MLVNSSFGLYFKCSDYVIPCHKEKMDMTDIYEDRAVSSDNLLDVADGIGGTDFPSGLFAHTIISQILEDFYSSNSKQLTKVNIITSIKQSISMYNNIIRFNVIKSVIWPSMILNLRVMS